MCRLHVHRLWSVPVRLFGVWTAILCYRVLGVCGLQRCQIYVRLILSLTPLRKHDRLRFISPELPTFYSAPYFHLTVLLFTPEKITLCIYTLNYMHVYWVHILRSFEWKGNGGFWRKLQANCRWFHRVPWNELCDDDDIRLNRPRLLFRTFFTLHLSIRVLSQCSNAYATKKRFYRFRKQAVNIVNICL